MMMPLSLLLLIMLLINLLLSMFQRLRLGVHDCLVDMHLRLRLRAITLNNLG